MIGSTPSEFKPRGRSGAYRLLASPGQPPHGATVHPMNASADILPRRPPTVSDYHRMGAVDLSSPFGTA